MTTEYPRVKTTCQHCNDEIKGNSIMHDDLVFCCQGCQMVYQLLIDNNLSDYYTIDANPGYSLKKQQANDFAFLSNKDIVAKLSREIAPNLHLVYFTIPQIHCSSCIWLLEKLYKINSGIYSSEVNFIKREVEIRYNPNIIDLKGIVELLSKIGYKPKIEVNKKVDASYDNTLATKIGIAGFAFGNIMLFSFPEYLGLEQAIFKSWFGWLNILLAIPVVFYAGFEYLKQGYQSMKFKTYDINIPLALGIIVMLLVSIYQIFSNTGPGYIDSLSGLIFFLLIGKWYQQRSFDYLSFERDYKSYFPISAAVIKDGKVRNIGLELINEGDELIIKSNQIVPVDGILLSEVTMMDYSFVNGEEEPQAVSKGEHIYAGGKLKDKSIHIIAKHKVQNSYLVSLWNNAIFIKEEKHKTLTDRLSKYFTLGILVIATSSMVYWLQFDIDRALNAFTAVLIVACPCAIALTTPFINGNLLRLLSRKGIFLRNSQVIDKAANIQHIVFDKTGTITSQFDKDLNYHGKLLTKKQTKLIHALVFQSIHPLSIAIEQKLRGDTILEVSGFKEKEGLGIEGICEGHYIKIGSRRYLNQLGKDDNETKVFISIDNESIGYFIFKNKYREGFENIISQIHKLSLTTSLLSGDNDKEKEPILNMMGKSSKLLFNQDPHQKMEYITQLKSKYKVAMIGDGLNDAGALKASDLGIVVTDDTNNFTPSSDIIFDAKNFNHIANFFRLCKASFFLIGGAYLIALAYNIIGLSYAVQGLLSPVVAAILMPLSSLTIVVYAVLSSTYLFKKYIGY